MSLDAHDGAEVRTEGDAIFAVFPDAADAVTAAAEAQRQLQSHPWPDDGRNGDYIGLAVHQAPHAYCEFVSCGGLASEVIMDPPEPGSSRSLLR